MKPNSKFFIQNFIMIQILYFTLVYLIELKIAAFYI